MSKLDVIRAWKDEEYRAGLSKEQLALLPENPAGSHGTASLSTPQGFHYGPTADCTYECLADAV